VEGKGFFVKQKEAWKSHLFHATSRRRWGLGGLVLSLAMIYFGLAAGAEGPTRDNAVLPPLSVLEGIGFLFGSLAELLPEEQVTLAGILRLWAGLFAACGFALMMVALPGLGPSGAVSGDSGGGPSCETRGVALLCCKRDGEMARRGFGLIA
jgi:hypothetical protein